MRRIISNIRKSLKKAGITLGRKPKNEKPIKIDILRQEAGYSWDKLAELTGVSKRTMENWSQRKRIPKNVYLLASIAKVLNCQIEDIVEPLENYDKKSMS